MSHTTPLTQIESKPPFRCYVIFYYEGKRQRVYNGKPFGKSCNPNHQKKMVDRKRELARLCELVIEALRSGWKPGQILTPELPPEPVLTAVEQIQAARLRFDQNGWARTYLRDMNRISSELIKHLNLHYPLSPLEALKPVSLARFLDAYRSSGRYYMNKRRNLSALFTLLSVSPNPVMATPTMRQVEHLNEAYKPAELMGVLTFLKQANPNLYLCALMTYGTLLRPHQEIRLLRRKDFDENLNFITLAGKATKTGKIRRVPVPEYIREELLARGVDRLKPVEYIFSLKSVPLNADYFTTAWSRAKTQMLKQGLIREDQTLYSFRHSAAIYTFENSQNLKLLQGLMGHGTPEMTVKYLRSLGITEASSPDDLPKLPGT